MLLSLLTHPQVLPQEESGRSPSAQDIELRNVVKHLGINKQDIERDFQLLENDPHRSVALLVDELHPIVHKAYFETKKTFASRHMIYCLRALHYITGETFAATTKYKLTDDERQFLDFKTRMHDANPLHTLHFFGVWMSRDADFVAPEDTQRTIIKMWRQWQSDNGQTFKYRPSKKPMEAIDEWYWYG